MEVCANSVTHCGRMKSATNTTPSHPSERIEPRVASAPSRLELQCKMTKPDKRTAALAGSNPTPEAIFVGWGSCSAAFHDDVAHIRCRRCAGPNHYRRKRSSASREGHSPGLPPLRPTPALPCPSSGPIKAAYKTHPTALSTQRRTRNPVDWAPTGGSSSQRRKRNAAPSDR